MPTINDAWGIDLGYYELKAMHLVRDGADLIVEDFEALPFKEPLTTPDLDVDEAIQVALDDFIGRHDLRKSEVIVGIPGHLALAKFAKLPPVEPKKVGQIVQYEAQQQIPFPIDEVEWDYQVFQQEDSPDIQVGIFAITKERLAKFLNNFRRVNLRVDALTLSPLAVYNAFTYEREADPDAHEGVIYMDIGTVATDLIIVENGGIWLRTFDKGGNHFTEALVRAFKVSHPRAEKEKKRAATSKHARQIFTAMRPVFSDLVQELQRSLGYYQQLNPDAELKKLIGVGSTFRLPGLTKFLKQQLQLDVHRPDGFKRLVVPGKQDSELSGHAINLATAYGLALQGLGLESVSANLMPRQILSGRRWKAKQPWFIGAAACVAAAAVAAAGVFYMDQASYESSAAAVTPVVDTAVNTGKRLALDWNNMVRTAGNPVLKIENLVRGQDYRDLYAHLLADVAIAVAAADPDTSPVDPDAAAVDRRLDKRIYIEEIQTSYDPKPLPTGAALAAGAAPSLPPDLTAMVAATYVETDFFQPGLSEQSRVAPRIVVTVTGTTPYRGTDPRRDRSRPLLKNIIDRLDRMAREETRGRPYRIVMPPPGQEIRMDEVTGSAVDDTSNPAAQTVPERERRGFTTGGGFGTGGGGFQREPQPDPINDSQRPSELPTLTLDELLPETDPVAQPGDVRFVIRFYLDLLPPKESRSGGGGGGGGDVAEGASPVEAAAATAGPQPEARS